METDTTYTPPPMLQSIDDDEIHARMLEALPSDIDKTEGGFAYDGAVGKAKVVLIGLTDLKDDAAGVREHHIVCQDQIVFRIQDLQQPAQIDVLVKNAGECRGLCHGGHLPSDKIDLKSDIHS